MKTTDFDTLFSVVCLPESPNLFMMNMQVFRVEAAKGSSSDRSGREPEAIVWCAVYQRPVIKKS